MTKKETCQALKVSERTIDKYVRAGRLSVAEVRTETNQKRADFDPAEVENLRIELEAPQPRATASNAPQSAQEGQEEGEDGKAPQSRAIARLRPVAPLVSSASHFVISPEHFPALAQALGAQVGVPIAAKLWLDLKEAAALSGLSRRVILAAVKAGRLAAHRGRGYQIKRRDLETWALNPFEEAKAQPPATPRKAPQRAPKPRGKS